MIDFVHFINTVQTTLQYMCLRMDVSAALQYFSPQAEHHHEGRLRSPLAKRPKVSSSSLTGTEVSKFHLIVAKPFASLFAATWDCFIDRYFLTENQRSEMVSNSVGAIDVEALLLGGDVSTFKTYQQSLADAGSETRPPMLERGSYIPWASRFKRFLNRKREYRKWLIKALKDGPYVFRNITHASSIIPRLQEIYNSVDSCKTAKEMWARVERLMRGTIQNQVDRETRFTNEFDQFVAEPGESLVSVYNRFAQLMNDLERNNMKFPTVSVNTKFLNSLQPKWLKYVTQVRLAKRLTVDSFDDLFDYLSQFEKLVNASRAKKLEKSHDPLALVAHTGSSSRNTSSYYVTHPSSVVDYDEEYEQDDVHNHSEDPLASAMLLLAKAITQNFSNPTNNRLRASSNTRNQAVVQGDRVNIQSRNSGNVGRNNRRAYVQEEVVEGMNATNETANVQRIVRTPTPGNTSTGQCYNCGGKGHYARNCPKPRVRDSKYFMEQMLLAKQDEAGVILTDEQNDFLFADASRMEEIEELSANICLMARIQPADQNSDDEPSYESAFVSEVQSSSINENDEQMYPTHTKIINSTIDDDQINSNIQFDSVKGNVNSGSVEKDTHVYDLCALETLARNAYDEAAKQQRFAQKVQQQNMTLTSQIEMYKERNRVLENITKDNNYLKEFLEADERAKRVQKQAESQLYRDRDIIRDLEKQRDKLSQEVKHFKQKNEELQQSHLILKRKMSENEDKYHDTILDLEEKLKKNVDLFLKIELFDYAQINALYKDFVPQKELSAEQKYFPSSFIPFDKNSNATPSIPASMLRMNVASSVRRPMNRDSHVKNSVLANSKKPAKKVAVYVRKNKQTDITSENVISNKENVIDVDVANASKAKTLLCVSCMQNVLIPCHDNCFANYKLNVHSNVRRTLSTKSRTPKSYDTTYVVHKTRFSKESTLSKSLDTTYVVSKPKIDVESTSKANVSSTKKRNLRDKSLSTYMKNKIQLRIVVVQIVMWIVDSRCSKHMTDETLEIIKKFIAQAQLNYKAKVCKIRTDNGTEFKNATLKAHYEKLGIMQQFSTARTPQQNGVVERRNRTLVEAARTMLIFSRLPEFLWAEASGLPLVLLKIG
ncbi:retrovirus-related pol polyprotein from transposon TNT 1-94 [Tanacetum coccineum]